jgi:hypothetical protein
MSASPCRSVTTLSSDNGESLRKHKKMDQVGQARVQVHQRHHGI